MAMVKMITLSAMARTESDASGLLITLQNVQEQLLREGRALCSLSINEFEEEEEEADVDAIIGDL